MKTIVTTGGRPDEKTRALAKMAAAALQYPYIERNKRSINRLQSDYDSAVLVAGRERFELYRFGMTAPFFFHPNSAAFRLKRVLKGEVDPLLEVTQLQTGDSFLDCTLGLASDSILAAYAVGKEGKVEGIEGDPDIAFIVKEGLKNFEASFSELQEAMGQIVVQQTTALEYLKNECDKSWDVVYIDPMFHAPIEESGNFTPLRDIGLHHELTKEWMAEAYRVCRRRVVVKDHFRSPVFKAHRLEQIIRPNTKFHFGYKSRTETALQ